MRLSTDTLWDLIESSDKSELEKIGGVMGVIEELNTDPKKGISSQTIHQRRALYGSNELPDRPIRSFWSLFLDALSEQTIIILVVCAVVSLVLEMLFAPQSERSTAWIDGAAILAAVFVVSIVTAFSNEKQEKQFAAINRIKSIYDVAVIRNGQLMQVKNYELVVGDIVQISQGDCVPADGIYIEGDGLRIDQSTANGESEAARKNENDPFLISNTHVVEGYGTFVILCVGLQSHHGRIFQLLNQDPEQTPLQEKLEVLAEKIGIMGIVVAMAAFLALFFPWLYRTYTQGEFTIAACREPLGYFVVALTVIACAVPEGLPLAVTISLAYSMRQMMSDNNFVRKLSSCETMGSATVICTDKTGTLTKNEMNVERVALGGRFSGLEAIGQRDDAFQSLVRRSIAVNTQASITETGTIGSQTECALLRFCQAQHGDIEQIRKSSEVVHRFMFDRNRKMMSTVTRSGTNFRIFTKGAPEVVVERCTNYVDAAGQIQRVTPAFIEEFEKAVNRECQQSYRVIALAFRDSAGVPEEVDEAEVGLTLICALSIRDSLRENTVSSIKLCQRAGVRVVMVTGDHQLTAEAVGRECGIIQPGTEVVTGAEVRKMPRLELQQRVQNISVVARSSPMDKHLIVTALKELGNVVAVTGDGTNDVPAMIAADVGLAMGKCGTELAKEASDIVVLDDDFKSIIRSIVWGRSVYNNIKRFLTFQLTASVVTLAVSFISAVILRDTPFKAVQLLWVNLIMDSLGALALATGRPDDSLLNHPPENKEKPLITPFMIHNIAAQSILQLALIAGLLMYRSPNIEPHSQHHYTLVFNVFVLCQMFNLVNARTVSADTFPYKGIFDNPIFFFIIIGIGAFQFVMVNVIGQYDYCTALNVKEWIITTALAALTLPVGIIARAIKPLEISCAASRHNF